MMRLLDVDLDFFLHRVAYMQTGGRRLDAEEYPPWDIADVIEFMEDRCGVTHKLPGVAVETHDDVFRQWRIAIDRGTLKTPFHVTHVDAHADLGLGDTSFIYIMSELLFEPPERRREPAEGGWRGLAEGNFLAFALACQWISELVYVYNAGGGSDIPPSLMEDFDTNSANLQLKAVAAEHVNDVGSSRPPPVQHYEPAVPFARMPFVSFRASAPFDMIFLARSPAYTPVESDAIYDEIINRYLAT